MNCESQVFVGLKRDITCLCVVGWLESTIEVSSQIN